MENVSHMCVYNLSLLEEIYDFLCVIGLFLRILFQAEIFIKMPSGLREVLGEILLGREIGLFKMVSKICRAECLVTSKDEGD